jgi:2-hydroxychromene-2-carboxylate isomerase
MNVTCFIDFTCPYSFRAFQWLNRLPDTSGARIRWATFSLKEANRDPGTPSPFDDPQISSLSVLALVLAQAARQAGATGYHETVFQAMHGSETRLDEARLLRLAAEAGVDVDRFNRDREHWLAAVAGEHRTAVEQLGVFGTPTLVLDDHAATFLKLSATPAPEQAGELWRSLYMLACCHPELIEIKRPPARAQT